jgi:hypothetical protein
MPELEITCPRTQQRVPTGIVVDARTLALTWAMKMTVKCPHCGAEHEVAVREAYMNGLIRDAQETGQISQSA